MTTYLLDTHVWLWMQAEPDRLRAESRAIIEDTRNRLLLSAVRSTACLLRKPNCLT